MFWEQNNFTRTGAGRAARLASIALLGIAAACSFAHANEAKTPPLSEDAFFDELPIVLTVTRLAQPKSETPAAVTVIDREMIRTSGVRRISDLFWLVPGFQVGYDHAPTATVTYHGLSDEFARRMQVLVDGRSVYDIVFGGVFWNSLPIALEDIERIEVTRGPNAVTYGSNSFLGVINIITRHASRDPGAFGSAAAGEHNVRDGTARYGWSHENGHSRLTAAYRQDDGFNELNDSSSVRLLNYRGDYRVNPRDTLELQLGISNEVHGEGEVGRATNLPRDADILTHFQSLHWRRAFAPDNEVSVQFYHTYFKNEDAFLTAPVNAGPLGIIQVPVNFNAVQERYDIEFQHLFSATREWRYVWGAGARLDLARSNTAFATDDTLENRIYRVFGNAEWRARDDTTVNAGAMLEKHGISGTDFLPRLALNHHLTPSHTVRAAASRATRTPSFIEEHGNVRFSAQGVLLDQTNLARGGLRAETTQSYELGYLGESRDRRLTLDVRVFRDHLEHLITEIRIPVPDLDGRAFSVRNEARAEITGAEFQLDYRPSTVTRLIANYARMHADVSDVSAAATFNEAAQERSVPRYTASLLAIHRFADRWEGSLGYHRVGAMEWLGTGGAVDAYGRIDLRLARAVRFGRAKGQVALTIQNLGYDTRAFNTDDVFDRRAFVTLTLAE